MISFKVSCSDFDLIEKIVDRAAAVARECGIPLDRQDARMDITAIHANGTPLRLAELAEADNFNFNHDAFGIFRHINRTTGQLDGRFLPRFAEPDNVGGAR